MTTLEKLNQLSLREIRQLFKTLVPPEANSLRGLQRGLFVGPGWLQRLWGPTLAISGLGNWWGKDFDDKGKAVNLVRRKGLIERRFPMYLVEHVSYMDGQLGLALRYQSGNPFPWPLIVDELRRVDETTVMGMTLVDFGPLRRLAFPFILQPRDNTDGL